MYISIITVLLLLIFKVSNITDHDSEYSLVLLENININTGIYSTSVYTSNAQPGIKMNILKNIYSNK